MAEFLLALSDFDRMRAWAELGYSNLFWFLHRELGLSMGAAHYRKVAAWLIQKHPELVQPLRDGRLCLTSIVELAKVLTVENSLEILPRYFHLSRREAAEVSAAIRPVEQPPLREVVTPPTATSTSPRCDTDVAFHVVENHPTRATSPPTVPSAREAARGASRREGRGHPRARTPSTTGASKASATTACAATEPPIVATGPRPGPPPPVIAGWSGSVLRRAGAARRRRASPARPPQACARDELDDACGCGVWLFTWAMASSVSRRKVS
jgi:hypothetical protein